jgi:hypothetical protein
MLPTAFSQTPDHGRILGYSDTERSRFHAGDSVDLSLAQKPMIQMEMQVRESNELSIIVGWPAHRPN